MSTIAEKVKCKQCKTTWYYSGYPAYLGCPNCEGCRIEFLKREKICDCCHGTGKRMQNIEKKFNIIVRTDNDQDRLTVMTIKK